MLNALHLPHRFDSSGLRADLARIRPDKWVPHDKGFDAGEVRIHIPIGTNAGVEFYSCGERLLRDATEPLFAKI
jgi:hypothetical protein